MNSPSLEFFLKNLLGKILAPGIPGGQNSPTLEKTFVRLGNTAFEK
jgi:hypothetical protein